MERNKQQQEWQRDALEMVRQLKAGKVVLHSTDTVWGLGANAKNNEAVRQIFELKNRSQQSSLIMLVDSPGMLERFLPNLPEAAWELMEVSDRPLTIVAPCPPRIKEELAIGMVAEDGTIAVRLVKDDYLSFIIQGLGSPLASSSANPSGQPTPDSFVRIHSTITNSVSAIAKYRRSGKSDGIASMIVKFDEHNRITIIRS
ncbi:MAG: translation factor Sua5 [Crocinitomicaceae bacterium]|nr:translation factor Sua5 [Crocinitomicaceae bacterium]|tara:strand:- start:103 stop:705 length:603 start_codon:yes stop_codon:yes gene_type:complete